MRRGEIKHQNFELSREKDDMKINSKFCCYMAAIRHKNYMKIE